MQKYAMVAINTKTEDDGVHIRRVLVSYKSKRKNKYGITNYCGTKFLASDPYFSKKDASHKYIFEDDYYQLKPLDIFNELSLAYMVTNIYEKRKYHIIPGFEIEFEADNNETAITEFNEREELR